MESIKYAFSYASSISPWIAADMATYSYQEKAEMHFMHYLAGRNALNAILYRQRFPRRLVPDQKMLEHFQLCLRETGFFVSGIHDTGRGRSMSKGQIDDDILQRVENSPDMSTREVFRVVNMPPLDCF